MKQTLVSPSPFSPPSFSLPAKEKEAKRKAGPKPSPRPSTAHCAVFSKLVQMYLFRHTWNSDSGKNGRSVRRSALRLRLQGVSPHTLADNKLT